MKLYALALILEITVTSAVAQTAVQRVEFEVASVKANLTGREGLTEISPTGRVNLVGATFTRLMNLAYRVQDYQVIGGPAWLTVDRFDIQGNPPADFKPEPARDCPRVDCPPTPFQIMMQGLLADRFQLKMHRETRELPVYDLTIGKAGFKLKEVRDSSPGVPTSPPPPPRPGTPPPTTAAGLPTPPPGVTMGFPFGFAASAVRISVLDLLLTEILGRPVIDKTGITGEYDFKVVYSREGIPNNGFAPPPGATDGGGLNASDPRPSIFTALQEELGLKLESTKGPVEVLVIDSVQRPSEN